MADLPYFDLILEARRRGDPIARVFERSVHWGYWNDPRSATGEADDLRAAMARLDREVLAGAELASGQRVLDAGCGFGGTLAAIAERCSRMDLVGLNVDWRQLVLARELAGRRSVGWRPPSGTARDGNRVAWVAGDACALPFPDGSFDRVLAVECVFLFPSRLVFLREAARVLRPGGRLALSDFRPRPLALERIGRGLERRVARGYGDPAAGWGEGDYRAMAPSAGLRVVEERDVSRHTHPTYRALFALFRRSPELARAMVWPTRILALCARAGLMRYLIAVFEKPRRRPDPP